ncbi:carbohydrate ABC transporter membrane protein 2, CUT1 family [Jatrophihabitans endophyticus]|uniref:Carbohydrate ABC transporter membrane protein 2, CUT1 family n=1 Tax=Jatrophihabitans endophyticus TaxID=1206085 RepID=A0A1M5S541_9ACTN|nr:carbohydrate ABC transporter permease [Jatrophihabitans endophyticus]SHH33589.1 carbohydrate ABC transporter membrane protein 2, CUT1 family [Jatrophihabitans endophyticus]
MTTSNPPILPTEVAGPESPTSDRHEKLAGPEATRAVRKAFSHPLASLVITVLTIVWAIPLVGFFINSFRDKEAVGSTGWWTWFTDLGSSTLSNYDAVLSGDGGLTLPLVNSLAITIPATIIPIFLAAMAAYALAWMRFRGSNFIFFTIFALQVVPLQMALVPLQKYFNSGVQIGGVTLLPSFGLKGTLAEIWLTHTMFSMPLAVFLLHNFIAQLPGELIEAARVDGASHLRIFRSVVLPLSMPAVASFGIFQFLWVWNDLLVAKTFGGSDASSQPVTARIQNLAGNFGSHQELLAPAGFLAIVIPLAVFLGLQRFFVRGLLAGSVKG